MRCRRKMWGNIPGNIPTTGATARLIRPKPGLIVADLPRFQHLAAVIGAGAGRGRKYPLPKDSAASYVGTNEKAARVNRVA
jgi:hypothetical protein